MSVPAVRFRLDFGVDEAVGPGKIALLEQIGRGGSLSQAARNLKMSYRRAWQLLDSLNSTFREPVVLTQKGGRGGGGATLTPLGRALIESYRAFEAEVQILAGQAFAPLTAKTRAPAAARRAARKRSTAPVRRLSQR
jgi:molybdate transport system regulatory protein